jgi:hypothetical protein
MVDPASGPGFRTIDPQGADGPILTVINMAIGDH